MHWRLVRWRDLTHIHGMFLSNATLVKPAVVIQDYTFVLAFPLFFSFVPDVHLRRRRAWMEGTRCIHMTRKLNMCNKGCLFAVSSEQRRCIRVSHSHTESCGTLQFPSCTSEHPRGKLPAHMHFHTIASGISLLAER